MTLKIKRIHTTETLDSLPVALPCYLTDEFQVWYYAVLDSDTVVIVSSNSCQIQTFDETFNSKYSVGFDELTPCAVSDFDEVYTKVRDSLLHANQLYLSNRRPDNVRPLPKYHSGSDEQITAQAS
jgi:hypothetical protein